MNSVYLSVRANFFSCFSPPFSIERYSSPPNRPLRSERSAKYVMWSRSHTTHMRPSYATTMTYQRQQRGAQHQYLSRIRKKEWQKRYFEQFLDEQVRACEIEKDSATIGSDDSGSG